MTDSGERISPERRHEHLVTLLGAYADDELSPERRREVDAHLVECARCVQEFRVQVALKNRLRADAGALEPSGALTRLMAHLAHLGPKPVEREVGRPGATERFGFRRAGVTWGGWLIAACLAALWALGPRRPPAQGMGMSMGPLASVSVDSAPEPIAEAALHNFRQVSRAALPQGPELASVQSQVPFSVPALKAAHMRLIGAWTTTIDGVSSAVLAYRCHDRLVIQYVVPEHAFFRPPRVREAVAMSGLYAAHQGRIHAVGWPGTDNGSFLVGEFTAAELAAMRM